MVNLQIRQFRESVIATANASELPIEIKRLVFVEVMKMLQDASDDVIKKEMIQAKEDSKKEGDTGE